MVRRPSDLGEKAFYPKPIQLSLAYTANNDAYSVSCLKATQKHTERWDLWPGCAAGAVVSVEVHVDGDLVLDLSAHVRF